METRFRELDSLNWRLALVDDGTGDWTRNWSLDGLRGWVRNTPQGMVFSAGPVRDDHACHAVLWTHRTFTENVRVEFQYTRLDTADHAVNILYLLATGTGEGPYAEDIMEWQGRRAVPYMKSYFETMNLLHVSYAAHPNAGHDRSDYIRARRYPKPKDDSFAATEINPDYVKTGFFAPGVPHWMTFIKKDDILVLRVANEDREAFYGWDLSHVEPVTQGRIGIRHMWTRCSRYADITVSTLE